MLKLIYLARRHPEFTPDQFTRRWRKHGALGMSAPFWRHALGYVQAETIRPLPFAGASSIPDGVACWMIRDNTFAEPLSPEEMDIGVTIGQDELETFAAPVPTFSLWATEERFKPGPLGGTTAFLFFTDAGKARATAEAYRGFSGAHRIILNNAISAEGLGIENGLPYAAVVEIAALDASALRDVLEGAQDAPFRTADVALITRECVLWDRMDSE